MLVQVGWEGGGYAVAGAAAFVFLPSPRVVAAVVVSSLSGTHGMIRTSAKSLDHKVKGPSKSIQHPVHPLQISSERDQESAFYPEDPKHGDQSA